MQKSILQPTTYHKHEKFYILWQQLHHVLYDIPYSWYLYMNSLWFTIYMDFDNMTNFLSLINFPGLFQIMNQQLN